MNNIKVSCCGFRPATKEYWQQCKLVEVQQVFYNPPLAATAHRWPQEKEQSILPRSSKPGVSSSSAPAGFTASQGNIHKMSTFLARLDRGDLVLVREPEGEWSSGVIRALCHELSPLHCVDTLQTTPEYGRLKYFRLRGGAGYAHRYSDQELAKLREVSQGAAYLPFTITMYQDALGFKQLVENGR